MLTLGITLLDGLLGLGVNTLLLPNQPPLVPFFKLGWIKGHLIT